MKEDVFDKGHLKFYDISPHYFRTSKT